MASHEINVKSHNVANLQGVEFVHVVLVLIASTEVGVAFIVCIGGGHGVLDGASTICTHPVSTSELYIYIYE
jgi:hypothetical protein